jgi:NifU-like protein involved in Fe-S cluster formation
VSEFSPQVIEHFTHPRHSRPLACPDGVGWVKRSDSRFMQIQVTLRGDGIESLAFGTYGCAPSIACGSYVCAWACGQSIRRARSLTAEAVVAALGGLPPARRDSADMAVEALHQAIDNALHNRSLRLPPHPVVDAHPNVFHELEEGT